MTALPAPTPFATATPYALTTRLYGSVSRLTSLAGLVSVDDEDPDPDPDLDELFEPTEPVELTELMEISDAVELAAAVLLLVLMFTLFLTDCGCWCTKTSLLLSTLAPEDGDGGVVGGER